MRWLRAIYLFSGLSVGAFYGYIPVLLQSHGFAPGMIGLAMSLGSAAYMLAVPVWGHVSDVLTGPRRALQVALIPAAIASIGYGLPLPFVAMVICQVVVSVSGSSSGSVMDSMTLTALGGNARGYSRLRILSSVGASSGFIACGFLYTVTGYAVAPILYVATLAGIVTCAQFVKYGRESDRTRRASGEVVGEAGAGRRFGSIGEAISLRPGILAVMAGAMIIFVGTQVSFTFVNLRIVNLGAGPDLVGILNGLGASAELPGMVLAGWLIGRFGPRPVLLLACACFAACSASYIVLEQVQPIIVARWLAGLSFCGIFVSLVVTFSAMLPPRLQATGQTMLGASTIGAGSILAGLAGGALYDAFGPGGAFGLSASCALAGGLVAFAVMPRRAPVRHGQVGPVPVPPAI